jgi:magnesium transporter
LEEEPKLLRAAVYDPVEKSLETGGEELIATWQASTSKLIWLDIHTDDENRDQVVLRQFDIHPLAIQDAMRQRHPPKIEAFENSLFILLRGLDANTTGIEFGVIQLSLFVGERFFLTRHAGPSTSANWLYEHIQEDPGVMSGGWGALAIALSNRLSRRYVEILLHLEPRLDELEEEMFERPNDRLLSELTGYKSRLRHLARIARYHQDIATQLKRGQPFIDTELTHEITDLYEQIERTQSLAALYYDIATDLTDGYLALSSHRLNRVMQILTIITVIFVPLTFLAGIYGMNFEFMPELTSRNGYFVVLAVMVTTALLQLVYFRRKGWM